MLFISIKYAAKDDHGIKTELILTLLLAPSIIVVFILLIVDPNGLEINRRFYWGWLFFGTFWFTWWVQFGNHVFQQWRADVLNTAADIDIKSMASCCQENPHIKKLFHEYASKQYVSEMINFMEDVAKYKELFYDKVREYLTLSFSSIATEWN